MKRKPATTFAVATLVALAVATAPALAEANRRGRARAARSSSRAAGKHTTLARALRLAPGQRTIVLATNNQRKVKELQRSLRPGRVQRLLRRGGLRVITLGELHAALAKTDQRNLDAGTRAKISQLLDIPENHGTFAGNAKAKASHVASVLRAFNVALPIVADDSGMSVPKAGGWPGVRSKRELGKDQVKNLYKGLRARGVGGRNVRLKLETVIAVAVPTRSGGYRVHNHRGVLSGTLLAQPQGSKGFGTDRVFGLGTKSLRAAGLRGAARGGKTVSLGQLDVKQKNRISSRGQALRSAKNTLRIALANQRSGAVPQTQLGALGAALR